MGRRLGAWLACGALALSACARPDASGIYLAKSDREAAMIQLVQTGDGAVTGRVEVVSIGPGGVLNDRSATVEGVAARRELVFRPAIAWLGGVSASGSFNRDSLTLSGGGSALKARKASLAAFEKAAAQLRVRAAEERGRVADAPGKQAAEAAEATAFKDAADKGAKLRQAALELRTDAMKINDGVAAAPDFGQRSAENTAKVAKMLQMAPTLPAQDRNQLSASANNVAVATYQIEVARYNYALGLDQIIQRGSPLATSVQRFCDTPEAAPFSEPCSEAKAAAIDFQSAVVHGYTVFKSYKQAVRQDEDRQNEMARKIGG